MRIIYGSPDAIKSGTDLLVIRPDQMLKHQIEWYENLLKTATGKAKYFLREQLNSLTK